MTSPSMLATTPRSPSLAAVLAGHAAPGGPAAPSQERRSGRSADVLASLLGLRASVELAEHLAAPMPPAGVPDPHRAARLLDDVRGTFEGTERRIAQAYADPFRGRLRVPDAVAMHAELEAQGALGPRTLRAATRAARVLFVPYGALLVAIVGRIRDDAAQVRARIADGVRALGPRAARLEALDGTLREGTDDAVDALVRRLPSALEGAFRAALTHAASTLAADATPAHLAPWFEVTGWVRAHLGASRALAQAFAAHERGPLEALVHAAAEAG